MDGGPAVSPAQPRAGQPSHASATRAWNQARATGPRLPRSHLEKPRPFVCGQPASLWCSEGFTRSQFLSLFMEIRKVDPRAVRLVSPCRGVTGHPEQGPRGPSQGSPAPPASSRQTVPPPCPPCAEPRAGAAARRAGGGRGPLPLTTSAANALFNLI